MMNKWDPNHNATYSMLEIRNCTVYTDPLIPITIANVEHQHMFLKQL